MGLLCTIATIVVGVLYVRSLAIVSEAEVEAAFEDVAQWKGEERSRWCPDIGEWNECLSDLRHGVGGYSLSGEPMQSWWVVDEERFGAPRESCAGLLGALPTMSCVPAGVGGALDMLAADRSRAGDAAGALDYLASFIERHGADGLEGTLERVLARPDLSDDVLERVGDAVRDTMPDPDLVARIERGAARVLSDTWYFENEGPEWIVGHHRLFVRYRNACRSVSPLDCYAAILSIDEEPRAAERWWGRWLGRRVARDARFHELTESLGREVLHGTLETMLPRLRAQALRTIIAIRRHRGEGCDPVADARLPTHGLRLDDKADGLVYIVAPPPLSRVVAIAGCPRSSLEHDAQVLRVFHGCGVPRF